MDALRAVLTDIILAGIPDRDAVVASVAHAIKITIILIGIFHIWAVITGIRHAVTVGIWARAWV